MPFYFIASLFLLLVAYMARVCLAVKVFLYLESFTYFLWSIYLLKPELIWLGHTVTACDLLAAMFLASTLYYSKEGCHKCST